MSEEKIFFQDFLFKNMPVDEQDYPTTELQRLPEGADISNYMVVSFDTMLKMNKPVEWEMLFKQTENNDVCIKDDVVINNSEMEPYKLFYLKTYYYNILKHSRNLYVF
ncbi:hypothetical protein [Lachnospira multipara]|jgi:hypothetical protein|uniref:hypothetical protein n=2 Tax=Lachnospira multipara TaxID=28051 RepID=UPI0004801D98|nr:hypothetical protein [Lachnospira multipara]